MRRAIDGFQAAALLVLGAITFVYFGPSLDKLFPVVDPFVISGKKKLTGGIEVSGWLHKRRECQLLEISGVARRSDGLAVAVKFELLDLTGKVNFPEGPQAWGPWRVFVPLNTEKIRVSSLHQCHPLWKTRTELAVIEID